MSLALFGVFMLPTAALHAQTCLASSPTTAPTCNVPLNAVATVSHLLQLTVAGGAQTNLASPTAATYDSSAAAGSSKNAAGKLSTDLAWSIDPNNAFAGLATTASTIVSNSTGSTATFTLYYRVKWLYASDVPGTYSLPVVFTVTGQ
jgi:hypothetical protein